MSAVAFVAVVAVAALALIWLGQRRMIYFPDTRQPSLERSGLDRAESASFDTADGLRLAAWFVPGSGSPPRATVLVFPGNAGHRGYRVSLAAALSRRGFNVLLIDYRGYGGNPGTPSEGGLAEDARAARTYVLSRSDVDPARAVYFGESLGAAVATRLAHEHPPWALILRSPFASLASIGQHHYPILPVRLLLRDRYPSIELAPGIRSPVLVVAGTRDSIIPIEHTRRLYDAIPGRKTFVEIAADHNDQALLDGEEMMQAIARFLRQP
jgi:fermentation-respiration switch protein FrsA (DUF1100 family)